MARAIYVNKSALVTNCIYFFFSFLVNVYPLHAFSSAGVLVIYFPDFSLLPDRYRSSTSTNVKKKKIHIHFSKGSNVNKHAVQLTPYSIFFYCHSHLFRYYVPNELQSIIITFSIPHYCSQYV